MSRMAEEQGEEYIDDADIEPPLVKVMDTLAFDTMPSARRLIELLRERGWTGWTKLARVESTRARVEPARSAAGPATGPARRVLNPPARPAARGGKGARMGA